jgi:hypothetical protein
MVTPSLLGLCQAMLLFLLVCPLQGSETMALLDSSPSVFAPVGHLPQPNAVMQRDLLLVAVL